MSDYYETFEKINFDVSFVIPAKAGIQNLLKILDAGSGPA